MMANKKEPLALFYLFFIVAVHRLGIKKFGELDMLQTEIISHRTGNQGRNGNEEVHIPQAVQIRQSRIARFNTQQSGIHALCANGNTSAKNAKIIQEFYPREKMAKGKEDGKKEVNAVGQQGNV
jgi:hypothetical protein